MVNLRALVAGKQGSVVGSRSKRNLGTSGKTVWPSNLDGVSNFSQGFQKAVF